MCYLISLFINSFHQYIPKLFEALSMKHFLFLIDFLINDADISILARHQLYGCLKTLYCQF